jgi:hypothetical protein
LRWIAGFHAAFYREYGVGIRGSLVTPFPRARLANGQSPTITSASLDLPAQHLTIQPRPLVAARLKLVIIGFSE